MELIVALVLFIGMIAIWTMMPGNEKPAPALDVEVAPAYLAQTQS
jgi:hypothetical protein